MAGGLGFKLAGFLFGVGGVEETFFLLPGLAPLHLFFGPLGGTSRSRACSACPI
jgi:hypothetical protein